MAENTATPASRVKTSISVRSHRLLQALLAEHPELDRLLREATRPEVAVSQVRGLALERLEVRPRALAYYRGDSTRREDFEALDWSDYATIRILDYCDNAGAVFEDLNLRGSRVYSDPIGMLWHAVHHQAGGGTPDFFEDMLNLWRQFEGHDDHPVPSRARVERWMARHPVGTDSRIVQIRQRNRDRILARIIERIDAGEARSRRFTFEEGASWEDKLEQARQWWKDHRFHLAFAIRDPELLQEMLGDSLSLETMEVLRDAREAGIPTFVNPYYLSLLNVESPDFAVGADLAIRAYVLYSRALVEEFGEIVAWEREDVVEPGRPNAAGWLLPSHTCIHRRYPEVAILIPETVGRACGGLCASCQRMYGFQHGELNFDLGKLEPRENWWDKLERLMRYFEEDAQLRDILVTGGDALMTSDRNLARLLDAIYRMAERKREANQERPAGEKYAEMVRVRLGTRLPVYLPQRITPALQEVLRSFKEKASRIGIRQFVIQTHFESAMEVTPEAVEGIQRLVAAGWTVTNQMVFTAAASRRGHAARLRQALNQAGVLPYYTFCVKGYMENSASFATNARAMQEQLEEKVVGQVPPHRSAEIRRFPEDAENMLMNVTRLRQEEGLPFLATDRNVLNLPGVGKSLTYRCIGLTHDGRRILSFDHDPTRNHSPIIEKMGRVGIIESKSIRAFLDQIEEMGEDTHEYASLWGYSLGQTEPREPVFEYPVRDESITDRLTNFAYDQLEQEVEEALASK